MPTARLMLYCEIVSVGLILRVMQITELLNANGGGTTQHSNRCFNLLNHSGYCTYVYGMIERYNSQRVCIIHVALRTINSYFPI